MPNQLDPDLYPDQKDQPRKYMKISMLASGARDPSL